MQRLSPVGAADLFVLRRVAGERFVHFGGSGRGEGWAGIVEVVARRTRRRSPRRCATARPVRARRTAAGARLRPVLRARRGDRAGRARRGRRLRRERRRARGGDDDALAAAAQAAAEAVEPPAPREAARRRARAARGGPRRGRGAAAAPSRTRCARSRAIAAEALSCELGVVYLADGGRLERGRARLDARMRRARTSLTRCAASVLDAGAFPYCVQDASCGRCPARSPTSAGIRSYYLLELTGLARGVLLVAHTDAAPRGFTLLCRRLGAAPRGGRLGRPRRRRSRGSGSRQRRSRFSGVRRARRLTTGERSGATSSAITSNQT